MTNTIPNVPRELKPCPFCGGEPNLTTADYVHDDLTPMPVVECKSCSAWVQADDWNTRAPSPAGVDGLKVVGYVSQDDIKWQGDCTLRLKPYSDYVIPLCHLSDAQAIIDGLRGEIESGRRSFEIATGSVRALIAERDQHTQRIGELEGLLRHAQKQVQTGSGLHMRIDAALSAGKDFEQ